MTTTTYIIQSRTVRLDVDGTPFDEWFDWCREDSLEDGLSSLHELLQTNPLFRLIKRETIDTVIQ